MFINCHTYFSFKYGTMSVKELLGEAIQHNISTLVLTDINNTSACLEFVRQCEIQNIKPVLGIDFRNGAEQQFIGIARNNEGYQELNQFLSQHRVDKTPFPAIAPAFKHCFVVYPEGKRAPEALEDHEFLGIRPEQVQHLALRTNYPNDKLVILSPVSFRDKTDYNTHRLLRAIDNNTLLSMLPKEETAAGTELMTSTANLLKQYWDFPHLIENTRRLLEECHVEFEFGSSKNKQVFTSSTHQDEQLLRELAYEGFEYRYASDDTVAKERLEKELKIIHQLGFSAYFLINWDIVRYARSKGYYYVGRGSGANSIVAYCLRITDVDPVDLDLYFERFINTHRSSPPDFDIDFSWKDRDDITEYILTKYGKDHAVLMGSYNTFQERSARRELAKVFGVPQKEIDSFIEQDQPNRHDDHLKRLIFKYASIIHGFPSHLSIHAGGILISEKPIYSYTAIDLPPKGVPVTHFDMITAEDIGLYKFDILSQRGLGHIKDAIDIIRTNKGDEVDIHRIDEFKHDPQIKALISQGRAIGCFYVESPAMRMLLSKLQCKDYKTLVAASSIIRPGVAKSGMMREYILRFHNPEKFEYTHPRMKELLHDTYGVMVYQEDVIKVAHHFAGLDLAEADILRRGMSGKFRSRDEFKRIEHTFFQNCRKRGYPEHITKEVWRQIESFSGYSFSKAHSASYAVESYQSLYLKAHYPVEFMVAVVNNFGGFYHAEQYLHEARMYGANIEAPCLNRSNYLTRLMGNDIFIGFIHVKSLERNLVRSIGRERSHHGLFKGLDDFIQRIPNLSMEQLSILIQVGALRFTGQTKKELQWAARMKLSKTKPTATTHNLFRMPNSALELPALTYRQYEDNFDEMELLGFPLCSPFELLLDPPAGTLLAQDLQRHHHQEVTICGYLVTIKNTRTSRGERMQFATFLDQQGFFFDTVHFPDVAAQFPFKGRGIYEITGKVAEEFNFYSIEVREQRKLPIIPDPRFSEEEAKQRVAS